MGGHETVLTDTARRDRQRRLLPHPGGAAEHGVVE